MRARSMPTFADLTPFQQVCWDRDGVPEFLLRAESYKLDLIGIRGGGITFAVQLDVNRRTPVGELLMHEGGWMLWVEDPVPRWITSHLHVYHNDGRA